MAEAKTVQRLRCKECEELLRIVVPVDRVGNAWGQDWLPCENKQCKMFGKEVKEAITLRNNK